MTHRTRLTELRRSPSFFPLRFLQTTVFSGSLGTLSCCFFRGSWCTSFASCFSCSCCSLPAARQKKRRGRKTNGPNLQQRNEGSTPSHHKTTAKKNGRPRGHTHTHLLPTSPNPFIPFPPFSPYLITQPCPTRRLSSGCRRHDGARRLVTGRSHRGPCRRRRSRPRCS